MKLTFAALLSAITVVAAAPVVEQQLEKRVAGVPGFDVSGYQPNVNMATQAANGNKFVYIKATEGTTFKSSSFSSQYTGATNAGLIRGAYHFAQPASSSGAAQARFFASNGGGWSSDGRTLPGTLDIEYNPSGATCYGLSQSAMVSWIRDFSNTYNSLVGRYPVIYSTNDWWTTCTGGSSAFVNTSPYWVARYSSSVGSTAPWSYQTFWQYADTHSSGGDADAFNGDLAGLKRLATG